MPRLARQEGVDLRLREKALGRQTKGEAFEMGGTIDNGSAGSSESTMRVLNVYG